MRLQSSLPGSKLPCPSLPSVTQIRGYLGQTPLIFSPLSVYIHFSVTVTERISCKTLVSVWHLPYNSQTCFKGSPKREKKHDFIRLGTPQYRFIVTLFGFKGPAKVTALKTGDPLIEVTT